MIKNEIMLQQSNKIIVHATSIDKLSDLLTTKFLSNPSLAIIDPNEKISIDSDRTELDIVSSEFGQVIFVANPNHILNHHQADIYPCDSASATMPDINKGYFNPHTQSLESSNSLNTNETMMTTIKQWFHQKFDSKKDKKIIDFYFKCHKKRQDELKNYISIQPHFERLYFILKNKDVISDILEQYQLNNNPSNNGYKLIDIHDEKGVFKDAFMYGLEIQFKKIIDTELKQQIKQDKKNNDEIKVDLDIEKVNSLSETKMYAMIWAALNSSHFYSYIQHLFKQHVDNYNTKKDKTNNYTKTNIVDFFQVEFEMQEKMYQDGLIKYHVSLTNEWEIQFPEHMELTKENVQQYFKNINGEHATRLSEYGMHEEITNWENYQIIAAINPIIQLDNLTNELYRLNRQELEQFIHQNEFKITLKNNDEIQLFNKHKTNIDEILENCHQDNYLDGFEEFTRYLIDCFPYAQCELEYLIIPAIVALSNQTLDLDHERFEYTIELLDDAVEELREHLYNFGLDDKNEINAAIEAISYFAYKIGHETFVPFYEVKMKECLDIDNKNFSHVLLPLSTLHQENNIQPLQYAINKFNELGIKPIFYEKHTFDENGNIKEHYYDKNSIIQELIKNNEIELVNEFKLDNAKMEAKQQVEAKTEQKNTKKRKLR